MSIQAVAWVLEFSEAQGNDRLVLLSIANHAGKNPHDGAWEAWPGLDTIAHESRMSRRTVHASLRPLVDGGDLSIVRNGAPDERVRKDRRTNLYRINGVQAVCMPLPDGVQNGVQKSPTGCSDNAVTSTNADQNRHLNRTEQRVVENRKDIDLPRDQPVGEVPPSESAARARRLREQMRQKPA